jgi:Tfp pilus assembly protein PilN
MINLNLLPAKETKVMHKELALHTLIVVGVWLLLIVLLLGIILSWGKFFLEHRLADVREQSILVTQTRVAVSAEVVQVNSRLNEIANIQKEHIRWSLVLVELAELVPPGNKVSELIMSSDKQNLVIKGISQTRANLLALEGSLKQWSQIRELHAPLSNLLSPENINFEFSASLDLP